MRLLAPLAPPFCVACGAPARRPPLCAGCAGALEWLPAAAVHLQGLHVWAPLVYEGPARQMVRQLKFRGAAALAGHMAAPIVARAPAGLLDAPLVPVPGRGHAEWLARAIARRTGIAFAPLLARRGGPRQVGRARSARIRQPPRFEALRPGGARLVLVDDVITTGATVRACAEALREAGWLCNAAVAYARTGAR